MLVVLIPFLLVANVVVDNMSKWPNGAEVTYRVKTTMELVLFSHSVIPANVTYALKCREKNNRTLICTTPELELSIAGDRMSHFTAPTLEYFEMVFNETGVERLLVPEGLTPQAVTHLKKIASLFSVGLNLTSTEPPADFDTRDSTFLGYCDSAVTVKDVDVQDNDKNEYTFSILPLKKGENVAVERDRQPASCERGHAYCGALLQTPEMVLVKYNNKMVISKNGYFKSSMTIGLSHMLHTSANEIITMEFEKIDEPQKPISDLELPLLPTSIRFNLPDYNIPTS